MAKSLIELEPGECRWPVEDGPPYRFCGAAQAHGSSYCAAHKALSIEPEKYAPEQIAVYQAALLRAAGPLTPENRNVRRDARAPLDALLTTTRTGRAIARSFFCTEEG